MFFAGHRNIERIKPVNAAEEAVALVLIVKLKPSWLKGRGQGQVH